MAGPSRCPLLPRDLCLVLGVVMRIASYLDLAQQTKTGGAGATSVASKLPSSTTSSAMSPSA